MTSAPPQGIAQHNENHDREDQKEYVEYIEQSAEFPGFDNEDPIRSNRVRNIAHADISSI